MRLAFPTDGPLVGRFLAKGDRQCWALAPEGLHSCRVWEEELVLPLRCWIRPWSLQAPQHPLWVEKVEQPPACCQPTRAPTSPHTWSCLQDFPAISPCGVGFWPKSWCKRPLPPILIMLVPLHRILERSN